ncbi:MAG: hypothetical protein ABR543_11320 [Gemmatimonadaceae bacterium]
MPKNKDSITEFFSRYPKVVSELADSLRSTIRSAIPNASETLDEPGRVVGSNKRSELDRAGIKELLTAAQRAAKPE